MAAEKRLFWLQLRNTYFNQLSQKKMRKQPQGLEMQVIYLRMMLLSLDNKGYIFYQGVYESIEEELAEEFNEPVGIIKQTIDFLIENKMVTTDQEDDSLFIPEALECTGSEGASAERMRRKRAKDKALQCDGGVTSGDGDATDGDTYKNKNKVREDKDVDKSLYLNLTLKEGSSPPPPAGAGGGSSSPSLIDCQECADEGKVNLSEDGIIAFYNRMEKDGWKINGRPVENLLKAMRGFAKNHKRYQKEEKKNEEKKHLPQNTLEFKNWLCDHGFNDYTKVGTSNFGNEIPISVEFIDLIFEGDGDNDNESVGKMLYRVRNAGYDPNHSDYQLFQELYKRYKQDKGL